MGKFAKIVTPPGPKACTLYVHQEPVKASLSFFQGFDIVKASLHAGVVPGRRISTLRLRRVSDLILRHLDI